MNKKLEVVLMEMYGDDLLDTVKRQTRPASVPLYMPLALMLQAKIADEIMAIDYAAMAKTFIKFYHED